MRKIYNGLMVLAKQTLSCVPDNASSSSKLMKFVQGQKDVMDEVVRQLAELEPRPAIWFHAASLGEFQVIRPLMAKFRELNRFNIVLTFFSPTGYEYIINHHELADCVAYLPLDTKGNAELWVKTVQPKAAIFAVSELWPNYASVLKENGIPSFLVAYKFSKEGSSVKIYKSFYRDTLKSFREIFVIDRASLDILEGMGIEIGKLEGNPLFDNAWAKSQRDFHDARVERFIKDEQFVFMAGSIHEDQDLELVAGLANSKPALKCIVVPHEISDERLRKIRNEFKGKTLLCSECDEDTDLSNVQVLIIDFIGSLAYLYRYASCAYIGGGFTPYLHSIIEATVYGLPCAFGPRTERKITPGQLIKRGLGRIVKTPADLIDWVSELESSTGTLVKDKIRAKEYVEENVGATDRIFNSIIERI